MTASFAPARQAQALNSPHPDFANPPAADPILIEQFRRALADWKRLLVEAARQCAVNHPERLPHGAAALAERMQELSSA